MLRTRLGFEEATPLVERWRVTTLPSLSLKFMFKRLRLKTVLSVSMEYGGGVYLVRFQI